MFTIILLIALASVAVWILSGNKSKKQPLKYDNDSSQDRRNLYNTQRKTATEPSRSTSPVDNSKVLPDYTVIDFETTGLDYRKDGIVQFSAVRYRNHLEVEHICFLTNPGIPIPSEASIVHGITDEDVKNQPPFIDKLQDVMDFIRNDILVAHNAKFGKSFLEYQMGEKLLNQTFDTLAFAKDAMGDGYTGNYKLSTLYKVLTGKIPSGAHDALADCRMTHEILEKLMVRLGGQGKRAELGWHTSYSRYWYYYELPKKEFPKNPSPSPDSPFRTHAVLFDGRIPGMVHRLAVKAVVDQGGDYCNKLRQKTTMVVLGENANKSQWEKTITERLNPATPIRLLSSDEFKRLANWKPTETASIT